MSFLVFVVLGLFVFSSASSNDNLDVDDSQNNLIQNFESLLRSANINENDLNDVITQFRNDAFLTAPEIIKRHGYNVSLYQVITPDGYILEMHRIPNEGNQPVFLQHGIMDSSAGWILSGPGVALAYILADRGYDVWLGNNRGNVYSTRHTTLSTRGSKYWDFSFHEIGKYDLPAMIDKILEVTKKNKVQYVAHSQGTTAFWVMCNESPKHCEKVISMNALAPVAYLKHVRSPIIGALALIVDQMEMVRKYLGLNELQPTSWLMKHAGQAICQEKSLIKEVCYNLVFLVTGYSAEHLNQQLLPTILAHIPAGASTKQFVHFGQLVNSNEFRQFDYGFFRNRQRYGSTRPPNYDLSKVTPPVFLRYSTNDWLTGIEDVLRLSAGLKNVRRFLVPAFNHLDFIFADKANLYVYRDLIKSMECTETNDFRKCLQ